MFDLYNELVKNVYFFIRFQININNQELEN
jgi:hypothetical protein